MAEKRFCKGDLVRFSYGTRSLQGVVIEDRGPIGIKGRHLYLVEFRTEPDYTRQIELPPYQLEPATHPVSAP